VAAAAAGLACSSQSNAALLAEESFDYEVGSSLAGQGPGNGFGSNTWTNYEGEAFVIDADSIGPKDPSKESVWVHTSGNHARVSTQQQRIGISFDTSAQGNFGLYGLLDDNGNIGADGKTLYLSFLFTTNEQKEKLGIELYRDGARAIYAGQNGNKSIFGTAGTGENVTELAQFTSYIAKNDQRRLYVLKFEFGDEEDLVSGWLHPVAGEPEPDPVFTVSLTDASFDAITFWNNANGTHFLRFDEVRVGTTFESVTSTLPGPVVPEPAMGLVTLGGSGLLLVRRQRRI